MAQLTCTDLTLGYEGTVVTEHLSFTVNAGEYWYIVGENGSGKSTPRQSVIAPEIPHVRHN